MFILQRYIIRQHIGPFLFGFFIVTLLWVLNLLFTRLGNLLSRGLSIGIILEFFLLNLAWIVALTVPMSVLLACLMAFGRLSSDHEITAIKASGINMMRIILPMIIIGILLCGFLIYFNNQILPDANHRLALLMRDIYKKRPTISLEPGIIFREIPNFHIMVKQVEEKENLSNIESVLIYDYSDPNINKTIVARKGNILVDEKRGILQITLIDGEIHEIPIEKPEEYRRLQFPRQLLTITIPDMVLTRSESDYRGDREQSAKLMLSQVAGNREAIKKQEEELNTYIRSNILRYFADDEGQSERSTSSPPVKSKTGDFALRSNIQNQLRYNKNILQRTIGSGQIIDNYLASNAKLMVEVHKKYSIPFACVVFVLVGAPLGILTRRGSMAISGGVSLIFFLIYWSFLIGGEELADRRLLSPFLAMWLANLLVGGGGLYLVFYTIKESTFIHWDKLFNRMKKNENLR